MSTPYGYLSAYSRRIEARSGEDARARKQHAARARKAARASFTYGPARDTIRAVRFF